MVGYTSPADFWLCSHHASTHGSFRMYASAHPPRLLASTVPCLTPLPSPPRCPSASLLQAFPFSVALLNIPRVENQFNLPLKGVHQPLLLARFVLPFVFLPSYHGRRGSSYRVQCDFLPIKIGSRKKGPSLGETAGARGRATNCRR